ncbi:hypothetical protein EBR96_10890, partial [bacterium]|nr:hypothetical protein [bacterium]
MRSKPGTFFNSRRLREDRDRLLRLSYFSDVSPPRLEPAPDKQQVNVVFDVTSRRINTVDAGLEYLERSGSEEPLTGFVRTELHHQLIPSDILAVKLQAFWDVDRPGLQGYSFKYAQPWLLNAFPLYASVGTWSERRTEFLTQDRNNTNRESFTNLRVGSDIQFSYPILDTLSVSIRGLRESVMPQSSTAIKGYDIRSFGIQLNHTTVGNPTNPRNGVIWTTTYEMGGNLGWVNLGGLTFKRAHSVFAAFTEIGDFGVLGARTSIGAFSPDASSAGTFENEGFDVGGPNTLRGYKETNPAYIGNKEILLNFEYRQDLISNLQGVIFLDYGYAFTGEWPTDTRNFKSGYGV